MVFGEISPGQQSSWGLLKKLGEGDAGEVYLVESLLEKRAAILKRPHRSAFSSDVIRQASQIETEGKILRALSGLRLAGVSTRLFTPALLDQSPPGMEFSERFFIVIEKAPGFDLNSLARTAHFGLGEENGTNPGLSPAQGYFLARLAQAGQVPPLVLLRGLAGVIELFEKLHTYHSTLDGSEKFGLVWNDVKPEHVFWDPEGRRLTVIDWGNGQFLEADGGTKDRRYTRLDDYSQYVQELGKFLADTAPDLHARLEWPTNVLLADGYPEAVRSLKDRLTEVLYEQMEGLREARQQEEILTLSGAPAVEQLAELEAAQEQVMAYGELPDFAGAERFCIRLAARLATENRLDDFRQLCIRAGQIPASQPQKWALLGRISEAAAGQNSNSRGIFLHALVSGLNDDWPASLWDLVSIGQSCAVPAWYDDLVSGARAMQLEDGPASLPPYVAVSRLAHTLQAELQKREALDPEGVQEAASLVRTLREDVVRKWNQVEPDPPDAGLEYGDLDRLLEGIAGLAPGAEQSIARSLDQPKAQVGIILDAWSRKDFETARRGLRTLLLWDPDRLRALTAERAILAAPAWLEKVYQGPKNGEPVTDFLTFAELGGRELRSQVGPARWLDLVLDAFARLRKGASPGELIAERPELLSEVFWLNDYDSRRPAPPQRDQPIRLDRDPASQPQASLLSGMQEGLLGPDGALLLDESLDTWIPEARGSSARVFLGLLRSRSGQIHPGAVKILRPDRVDYGLPLFREETQILTMMRDIPGVSGLLECGYIRLAGGAQLPSDERTAAARDLQGEVLRFGATEIRDFLAAIEARISERWLPYLAMEKRAREDSLMALCDAGYTHGRFLPVDESLRLGVQICDILQAAHARNIVYRDHKILHYYWQEADNGVFIIDWNVARRHPQGLSNAERQFDLVQFGARALHHILTGRPAPGALPLGPTRPEEIEHAAHSYRVHWTYDDKRLPSDVKGILEAVLVGSYDSVKPLREDLYQAFLQVANGNG